MEEVELDGLVVREVKTGEADKLMTLLTKQRGKISVSGKGVSSLKNQYAGASQLFAYGTYLLRKRGNYWTIRDAAVNECFMNLRYDIEKLSLANYICDVATDIAVEDEDESVLLQLTLNTLHAIANRDRLPLAQIKGAFEFRLAVQEGFMPMLSGCGRCGAPIEGECKLDVMNGCLLCRSCAETIGNDPDYYADESRAKIQIRVTPSVLAALRYLETAAPARLLSFSLDETELSLFSVVCERYLLNHLEHGYSSLEYYKKIGSQRVT